MVSLQKMSATCIIIMAIFVIIIISLSIVGLADNKEMGEPFGIFFSLNKLNKKKKYRQMNLDKRRHYKQIWIMNFPMVLKY